MTDHPRLQTIPFTPDRAHLSHHGAPLVQLAFRLVDWWLGSMASATDASEGAKVRRVSQHCRNS
jgi:hypothetical protein